MWERATEFVDKLLNGRLPRQPCLVVVADAARLLARDHGFRCMPELKQWWRRSIEARSLLSPSRPRRLRKCD